MKIDKKQFLKRLDELGYGTGTIASAIGVPGDIIQQMIFYEEVQDEAGEALEKILGPLAPNADSTVVEEPEEPSAEEPELKDKEEVFDIEKHTIADILELVSDGVFSAEDAYAMESARDDPRSTLLTSLEEDLDVAEE